MALLKANNSKGMYFPRKACQANDRLGLLLPAEIRFSLPLLHPHTHSHPQCASQQLRQQLSASHHKLIKTTHHHLHRQPEAVHTGWRGVSMSDNSESILSSEASIHHRTYTDHRSQSCQHYLLLLLLLLLSLMITSTAKKEPRRLHRRHQSQSRRLPARTAFQASASTPFEHEQRTSTDSTQASVSVRCQSLA
jgi:hypothetical protein